MEMNCTVREETEWRFEVRQSIRGARGARARVDVREGVGDVDGERRGGSVEAVRRRRGRRRLMRRKWARWVMAKWRSMPSAETSKACMPTPASHTSCIQVNNVRHGEKCEDSRAAHYVKPAFLLT